MLIAIRTLCLLVLGSLLAAGAQTPAPAAAAPAATPPKILRYATGSDPDDLDPALNSEMIGSQILLGLFEGLVVPDPVTLAPRAATAERWEISPDGTVYTFHLRPTARWTDGQPVIAKHFVDAWRRVADPATAATQASRLYYLKNGQAINEGKITDLTQLGVAAPDNQTLVVTLAHAFPPFLELLTMSTYSPVRLDVVAQFGGGWTRPEHIVSNGAFRLTEWTPQKQIVLTKSANYWNAATVQLDQVVYLPIEDTGTAVKMFQAGDLDYVYSLPTSTIPAVEALPEFKKSPMFASNFFIVNVQQKPVHDVRVRKALSMAIDRETLCRQFLRGICVPAHHGEIPKGVAGFTYPPPIPYDPAAARALLKAAGYTDPAAFPKITVIYNTNETHKLVATIIQQMWKQNLGIAVELQNLEWKALLKQIDQHQFAISRFGGVGEYVYPTTYLETYLTGASGNRAQYANPQYDALWHNGAAEPDPAKKLAIYARMNQMLMDDMVVLPINDVVRTYLIRKKFGNLVPNLLQRHPPQFITVDPAAK